MVREGVGASGKRRLEDRRFREGPVGGPCPEVQRLQGPSVAKSKSYILVAALAVSASVLAAAPVAAQSTGATEGLKNFFKDTFMS